MSDKNVAVFGIYSTHAEVEHATEQLGAAGLSAVDASVLMPHGGVAGVLVGLGLPEYEAQRYEGHVQNGGILISVHCETSGEIARAKEIMLSTNGDHISSSGESMVDTVAFPLVEADVKL